MLQQKEKLNNLLEHKTPLMLIKDINMEKIQMSNTEQMLAQHPILVILTSISSFILTLVGSMVPILQALALIATIVLTCLTIESKWKERRIKNKKNKKHEEE